MGKREIYSTSLHNIADLATPTFVSSIKNGKVIGVDLPEHEINAASYNTLSKVDLPYVIIIGISSEAMEKDLSDKNTSVAERIIPLLMHHSQYHYFLHKPLLIKTQKHARPLIQKWNTFLLKKFSELGVKNVSPYYNTGHEKNGPLLFEELVTDSNENHDSCVWLVHFTDSIEQLSHLMNPNKKFQLVEKNETLRLKEENAQLKSSRTTLLNNINDLNNYYRFVRGETTFNYHNRVQENDPVAQSIKPEEITLMINTTGIHPSLSGVEEYKAYYNKIYEQLPSWYKKVGALLKIVMLRRELFYYISPRHKKIFLDMIYSLPDEKQIRIWYYYEYEILPGWYKRIGKFFKK